MSSLTEKAPSGPLISASPRPFIETVRATIELGHEACKRLGIARPRIAVCGLNPHAGEFGLIGDEDGRFIQPGIEQARERP